jgi:hypothetical protein
VETQIREDKMPPKFSWQKVLRSFVIGSWLLNTPK